MLALTSMLATSMAVSSVPVSPQNWVAANTTVTMSGDVPGIHPGTQTMAFSYDYEGKMSKEVYSDGTIAVYRYDKNVPGESWSRAYKWKTGQEALCCYVNLCKADPCQFGERSHMTKAAVDPGATDVGPSGEHGEHWHHESEVKILKIGDIADWIVDTNTSAITRWESNATVQGLWAKSVTTYGGLTIGGLGPDDFDYPKPSCDAHICDAASAAQLLHIA